MLVPKQAKEFAHNYLKISADDYELRFYRDHGSTECGYYDINNRIVHMNTYYRDWSAIETFFHELVHVRQGKLKLLEWKNNEFYWKGRPVINILAPAFLKYRKGQRRTPVDEYWESPHEIQARRISRNMLIKYQQQQTLGYGYVQLSAH